MDRIIFSSDDVNWLLTWRDDHKEEVRSSPTPMRSIQMEFPEVKRIVKCIREGNWLRLALNEFGRSTGYCEMELKNNAWELTKNKNLKTDQIQTMLTVYSSLMALLVYGSDIKKSSKYTLHKNKTKETSKVRKQKGVSYIIRNTKYFNSLSLNGHHRSPRGVFSVRGHYRHYKNGQVIWINEYKKGEGSTSKKTYKLGHN